MNSQQTHSQTRKTYPKKKRLMYEELQKLPLEYNVIALSKVTKVRAAQLMMLRKKFRETIRIRIIKNKVAQRAFEKITNIPKIEDLSKLLEGQCALMFTKINPFQLNLIFDKNKILLAAKDGDIASSNILINAGNTGINPGPVLSEFKEANVPTKIDQGTIWVVRDTLVAKPGDRISGKLASVLNKVGIKPIEAGISVSFAIAEGLVLHDNELRIDLSEYSEGLAKCVAESFALATETGYVTAENIGFLLIKAQQNAVAVSMESGYVTESTIGQLLAKCTTNASALEAVLIKQGYDPK
ncbi:MAG TPA: 50S ribosomal protein L10 [Nitrososphaeraceae archaeon]